MLSCLGNLNSGEVIDSLTRLGDTTYIWSPFSTTCRGRLVFSSFPSSLYEFSSPLEDPNLEG